MSAQSSAPLQQAPPGWPDGIRYRAALMGVARILVGLVAIAAIAGIGFGIGRATGKSGKDHPGVTCHPAGDAATEWTCSMHPQIRLPRPGQCPICFMDLIPVKKGDAN